MTSYGLVRTSEWSAETVRLAKRNPAHIPARNDVEVYDG